VAFALKLDYFKPFKEVDLSEGGFPDRSGEHEGGEGASQKPRSVRKLLKSVFYQGLFFRPWWERGYEGRLYRRTSV
jgi:hypothetical protein